MSYYVKITLDAEASVWYVEETNVPGLSTEAASVDAMLAKLDIMIPEMLADNCNQFSAVPFELIAHRAAQSNHCH